MEYWINVKVQKPKFKRMSKLKCQWLVDKAMELWKSHKGHIGECKMLLC